jgi:hypothetical protein
MCGPLCTHFEGGVQRLAPAILWVFRSKPVKQTEGAQRRRFGRRMNDEVGLY